MLARLNSGRASGSDWSLPRQKVRVSVWVRVGVWVWVRVGVRVRVWVWVRVWVRV